MLNVSWAKKRAGFVRMFAVQEGRGTAGWGEAGKRENDRQERHKTKKIRKDWKRRKVGGGGGENGGGKTKERKERKGDCEEWRRGGRWRWGGQLPGVLGWSDG